MLFRSRFDIFMEIATDYSFGLGIRMTDEEKEDGALLYRSRYAAAEY